MIVTPVAIPDASLPLPDPNDLSTWALRMAEQHRWMRETHRPGANDLATAGYENALDAQASAMAAAAASGAAMWSAATNYPTGTAAKSPSNYLTYVRKSPGGVDATDPALSALWQPLNISRLNAGVIEHFNGTEYVPHGWKELGTFATTSGTSVLFSSIPAWVRELSLVFSGVSLNATGFNRLRLGTSGGLVTTGYITHIQSTSDAGVTTGGTNTDALYVFGSAAGSLTTGELRLIKYGNLWTISGAPGDSGAAGHSLHSGRITLASALTQIEVAASAGAFDAGSVSLLGRA